MKMIKLSEEHYIGVDESEIKNGDYIYWEGKIVRAIDTSYWSAKKITHSTQPIENLNGALGWKDIDILLLSEVKELFGVVDVEKKAQIEWGNVHRTGVLGYIDGYKQALEDNKHKKYTERDLIEAYLRGATDCHNKCIERNWKGVELNVNTDLLNELAIKHIKSIQPKTEWEVEFVDGKLKLK